MSNPCLNVGHTGASGVTGQKQIKSLLDVTTHIEDYFKQSDVSFRCERNPKGSLVPGGVGVFQFKRAGEGIFYSNGLPVLFVTRLSSENGCDANIGKWYRKQWYYENYLRKINPDCTHLTFIHASESTGILSTLIAGVSMVMAQDFNQHTFNSYNKGGNTIYYYDTDRGNDTWYDIHEKIMNIIRCSKVKVNQPDLFTQ
jgi:hypothetical protein